MQVGNTHRFVDFFLAGKQRRPDITQNSVCGKMYRAWSGLTANIVSSVCVIDALAEIKDKMEWDNGSKPLQQTVNRKCTMRELIQLTKM